MDQLNGRDEHVDAGLAPPAVDDVVSAVVVHVASKPLSKASGVVEHMNVRLGDTRRDGAEPEVGLRELRASIRGHHDVALPVVVEVARREAADLGCPQLGDVVAFHHRARERAWIDMHLVQVPTAVVKG